MKVTKLRLENFRIHKDSVLFFGDSSFIVIRGRNFAGKSAIGQGLSMCLTPTTSGLDPTGKGFITKIKRGAPKAVITAEFQTKHHLIQRTVTLNASTATRTPKSVCLSDPTWKPIPFDNLLEKQRPALTVVLNTDAFLRMDEKEQKNLLAGLALPSSYDFPPLVVAEVETVLGQGTINFASDPFNVINFAYKKLYDERQIVNRQVKEFIIPEAVAAPENVDSASLQEQLTTLRMKRREKEQERDKALAEASKEEQARTRAQAKVQQAMDSEDRRKAAIREKLIKEGQLSYLRKMATGKEEKDKLAAERQQHVTMCDGLQRQITMLEAIPWGAKTCPTCDQPVNQDALKALAMKLKEWQKEANVALTLMDQKIKALGDVDGALVLITRHEDALRELDAFDEQAGERQRQIEEAKQDELP